MRGLLRCGPPGTGKTHTTRYPLGQLTGYTRLVLTAVTATAEDRAANGATGR
jgi:cell division protease FtsH